MHLPRCQSVPLCDSAQLCWSSPSRLTNASTCSRASEPATPNIRLVPNRRRETRICTTPTLIVQSRPLTNTGINSDWMGTSYNLHGVYTIWKSPIIIQAWLSCFTMLVIIPTQFAARTSSEIKYKLQVTFIAAFVMVALCNRADHFHAVICSSFFPRLISAVGDWMSTILPHMVWP